MIEKKSILAIIGSASSNSANLKIVEEITRLTSEEFNIAICNDLKNLPHFNPELSIDNPPTQIISFRKHLEQADGIIICTPEYVFSIPSGLKNAIEWCVSTTLFTNKPTGIITASASGQKGHEELQLIMGTLMAKITDETTLLIQGVKGKFDEQGNITNADTLKQLGNFVKAYINLLSNK